MSGCTATCALVTPTKIYLINAGDSRTCVLNADGTFVSTVDHKPNDDVERRRIEAAGGRVVPEPTSPTHFRVDGSLAVSRGFGDFSYKLRGDKAPFEQRVSCEPDITIVDRRPEQKLVIACDGVWDVLNETDVRGLIESCKARACTSPAAMAQLIAN